VVNVKHVKALFAYCVVVATAASSAFAQNGRPLTLQECIAIALKNNSSVLNAERQMNVAGTNVMTARAAVLPTINTSFYTGKFERGDQQTVDIVPIAWQEVFAPVLSPNLVDTIGVFRLRGAPTAYARQDYTIDGFRINSNSARLSLSWRAFDFGQSWYNIRSANAAEDASQMSYHSTRQATILLVQQRYFEHLKALHLLEVQQEAVKSNEEQLKRTESMYEIGSVAQGDVFRQRTTYGNSQIGLIRQQNALANTRAALNIALGRRPNAELDIQDIEEVGEQDDHNMEEVLKVALEKNPDLRGLEMRMRSAEFQHKSAKLNYLPAVTLSASYDRQNPEFNLVYGDLNQNYNLSFGVSLSFNIFNGFSDQAEVERQSLNYHIAKENLIDRQRNLQLEVEQALLALKAAREIAAINEDNLKSAEEDLRLAQERYRVGAGTLLEIINAQYNLTNAKATLVSAKYDMMIARAQLRAAMGTLGQ
jgi:outer membrane protein TolC